MREKKIWGMMLIELVIGLAILAIMLSFTLPSLSAINQNTKDKLMAERLAQFIIRAQAEARLRGINIYLCGSSDGQHCDEQWSLGQIIYMLDKQDNETRPRVLAFNQVHAGILQFRAYPRYRHDLQFFPRGVVANDNATFWYCSSQKNFLRFAISLSQFGRVQIVYPDRNNTIHDAHGKIVQCA